MNSVKEILIEYIFAELYFESMLVHVFKTNVHQVKHLDQ